MVSDLFGMDVGDDGPRLELPKREPLVLDAAPRVRGKHYVEPRGYAARPGTGPEGKTCRDCAHYVQRCSGGRRSFPKCGRAEHRWTGGRGSDILARAPACSMFEARQALTGEASSANTRRGG